MAHQNDHSDTITARLSMAETIRGDTVMFKHPDYKDHFRRYFLRNVRYPFEDSLATIQCKLYFILNKEGHVTDAWCEAGTAPEICKELTGVVKKMPVVLPSFAKGKPVITRVETRFVFVSESDDALIAKFNNYENDIIIIHYSVQKRHK